MSEGAAGTVALKPSERIEADVGTRLAHFRKTHFANEPVAAPTSSFDYARQQAVREKISAERERFEWISLLNELDREAERRSIWEKRVEAFARGYGVEI